MLGFLKKLLGFPTQEEVTAAKQPPSLSEAPYKVEPVVVNTKTGDVVDVPKPTQDVPPAPVVEVTPAPAVLPEEVKLTEVVNSQITDSVTQAAPAKKPRKPRTPKAEKAVKEKAAKPKKAAAAMKSSAKRSKKA